MKKIFDLLFTIGILVILLAPMILIAIAVRSTSTGPILFWSNRIGRNNKIFKMPKFRTMVIETPTLATHLMINPDKYLSPIGKFLRRSSLDELPQLYCVLKGEMSLVGPRPALYNEDDLIAMRTKKNIDKLLPGLTGWAQVNGRDKLSMSEKVSLDFEYSKQKSFWFDFKIILMTLKKVLKSDGVSH